MPTDAKFESFREELNRLVEAFGHRISELQGPEYNETVQRIIDRILFLRIGPVLSGGKSICLPAPEL